MTDPMQRLIAQFNQYLASDEPVDNPDTVRDIAGGPVLDEPEMPRSCTTCALWGGLSRPDHCAMGLDPVEADSRLIMTGESCGAWHPEPPR